MIAQNLLLSSLRKKGLADWLAEKAKTVREMLMFCETLSSGVRNGIYDEKIIRDNISTTLINIFDMSENFIKPNKKRQKEPKIL